MTADMQPVKTYGSGEKVVLTAEDDHESFRLLHLAFGEAGGDFRMYRVEDGEQALLFLRRSGEYLGAPRPDLVLLNLNMPRVTGYDVLRVMKEDAALCGIPAVVFTSSRLDTDRAVCLALGARDFVTKPIDFDEFVTVLRKTCKLVH